MLDPAREEAMAYELDDVDDSDPEIDDYTEFPGADEDAALGSARAEDAPPAPTPRVARMNLNTINIRTGGFAWFSA